MNYERVPVTVCPGTTVASQGECLSNLESAKVHATGLSLKRWSGTKESLLNELSWLSPANETANLGLHHTWHGPAWTVSSESGSNGPSQCGSPSSNSLILRQERLARQLPVLIT